MPEAHDLYHGVQAKRPTRRCNIGTLSQVLQNTMTLRKTQIICGELKFNRFAEQRIIDLTLRQSSAQKITKTVDLLLKSQAGFPEAFPESFHFRHESVAE